jgi:hypothetical protein
MRDSGLQHSATTLRAQIQKGRQRTMNRFSHLLRSHSAKKRSFGRHFSHIRSIVQQTFRIASRTRFALELCDLCLARPSCTPSLFSSRCPWSLVNSTCCISIVLRHRDHAITIATECMSWKVGRTSRRSIVNVLRHLCFLD